MICLESGFLGEELECGLPNGPYISGVRAGAIYPGVPCKVEPPEGSSIRLLIPKSPRLTHHVLGECDWIGIFCGVAVSLDALLA